MPERRLWQHLRPNLRLTTGLVPQRCLKQYPLTRQEADEGGV